MPLLTLDAWIGHLVGALRYHRVNPLAASELPADEQSTYGSLITVGASTIRYGTRMSESHGREAFCEIFSQGTLVLRVTHRMFVRDAEGGVVPRVWMRELGGDFVALFSDSSETTECSRSISWIESVLPRVLTPGPVPAEA